MQFHWEPDSYLELMREEVPQYERLQSELVAGTRGLHVARILELGVGTGETARRVLAAHPQARLVGIDSSEQMVTRAREALPPERTALVLARLEDRLPDGPFDLVVSALAVHHLRGPEKADLFKRVHCALEPDGRFVLADVVEPDRAEDAITPIDPDYDFPSSAADQLAWLDQAGFAASLQWSEGDLAVLVADRVRRPSRAD